MSWINENALDLKIEKGANYIYVGIGLQKRISDHLAF